LYHIPQDGFQLFYHSFCLRGPVEGQRIDVIQGIEEKMRVDLCLQ
jgi:hypothetical protein